MQLPRHSVLTCGSPGRELDKRKKLEKKQKGKLSVVSVEPGPSAGGQVVVV